MATPSRPKILVIWGDDIGIWNLSCHGHGTMGYRTPNIDRIAAEGMLFTDAYGEQSCTAGRSAFITGQSLFRTGLSKVGAPGMDVGLASGIVEQFSATFRDFPPRQKAATFTIDQALERMKAALGSGGR